MKWAMAGSYSLSSDFKFEISYFSIVIKARADSHACPVVFLEYVLILFSAENVPSTDAVDTGMVKTRQVSRYN